MYAAESSPALPVALFVVVRAGMPFVPVNYRLADDRLRLIAARQVPAVLLCDAGTEHRFVGFSMARHWSPSATSSPASQNSSRWRRSGRTASRGHRSAPAHERHQRRTEGRGVSPHRHLTNYIVRRGRVPWRERGRGVACRAPPRSSQGSRRSSRRCSADADSFSCRRSRPTVVGFIARREGITHAMTVPTMLSRILDAARPATNGDGEGLPSVRHLVVRRRTDASAGHPASAVAASAGSTSSTPTG